MEGELWVGVCEGFGEECGVGDGRVFGGRGGCVGGSSGGIEVSSLMFNEEKAKIRYPKAKGNARLIQFTRFPSL